MIQFLFTQKLRITNFQCNLNHTLKSILKLFFNKEDENGKYTSTDGGKGKPRYKRYLKDCKGIAMDSVFTDIKMLGNISKKKERVGYPTQKPLTLLNRLHCM